MYEHLHGEGRFSIMRRPNQKEGQMFLTGAPDKKSFLTHTHTQTPRAPGTSKSRLLYLSDTSTPGAAERRKEGSWRVEMEMVTGEKEKEGGHGHEREKEIKLKVDGRGEEVCVES